MMTGVATPVQMALVAATIAGEGVMPQPYVVRDVRAHADDGTLSQTVLDQFGSGGTRVISTEAARATRTAMVDAVNGELGRLYAGQGDVTLYGIGGQRSASRHRTRGSSASRPPRKGQRRR